MMRGSVRWLVFGLILLVLGLLVLAPIGSFLALSFATATNGMIDYDLSLSNYHQILSNATYTTVIWQSIALCLGVMAATLGIGYPLAYFIWSRSPRLQAILLVVFALPLLMSYIVKIYTMRTMLGTSGPLNSVLLWSGILSQPSTAFLHSRLSIFITMTVILVPFAILPIYLSLSRLPDNVLKAAADLGARPIDAFRLVVLPLTAPGTLAGGLFAFILAFGDYVTPQMVGGPSGFTVGRVIWSQFGLAFNWPFGAALGVVVLLLALITIALAGLLSRKGVMR